MTIYATAYDTTVGAGLVMTKTELAIKQAFIQDMIYDKNLDLISSLKIIPVFITGQYSTEANIPLFAHPFMVNGLKNDKYLCSDVRSIVCYNGGNLKIKNNTEYGFNQSRMVMNLIWLLENPTIIKNNLKFANTVFAGWLSDSIAKRYGLDPKDQMILFILSHCYYQLLFTEDMDLDEDKKLQFSVHIINASRAPSKMVFEVLDKIQQNGKLENINDYCQQAKLLLENIRIKDLSAGMIITIIGNTWFGLNAKEILAVALEHPPTWVALVNIVLNERTYKNSMLAKLAERYGKNNQAKEFSQAFKQLVEGYTVSDKDRAVTFSKFE